MAFGIANGSNELYARQIIRRSFENKFKAAKMPKIRVAQAPCDDKPRHGRRGRSKTIVVSAGFGDDALLEVGFAGPARGTCA